MKAQVSLVDTVSDAVALTKAGREFKACCPFHEEDIPSFYVVPTKAFWHCFGCGRQGDVVDFVSLREGVSEVQAAQKLIKAHNVSLPATLRDDWHLEPIERARNFLRRVGAPVLAELLKGVRYEVRATEDQFWSDPSELRISCPRERGDALRYLSDSQKERILRSLAAVDASVPSSMAARQLKIIESSSSDPDPLLSNLIAQQGVMIDVATGGARINDVDDFYRLRRSAITEALAEQGLENPNPHEDLWSWYRHWKAEEWSYHERRRYVWDLFDPLVEQVLDASPPTVPVREPTGWARVDRGVDKARAALDRASHEEDFQGVGLLCREILISLGQSVFDPRLHETHDGVAPSKTDAERMLDAFVASSAGGRRNESIRRHAKTVLKLAVELQHKRTADFRIAALSLEATASLVNVVAILAGKRDR